MRWSTPSFGLGLGSGLGLGLLAVLVVWLSRPLTGPDELPAGSEQPSTEAAAAMRSSSRPALQPSGDSDPLALRSGESRPVELSTREADVAAPGAEQPQTRARRPRHRDDEVDAPPTSEEQDEGPEPIRDVWLELVSGTKLVEWSSHTTGRFERIKLELNFNNAEQRATNLGGYALTDSVRLDWERAWGAAGDWGVDTKTPDPSHVDALLASRDGGDVLLGIGLAARNDPPLMGPLVRVVRDRSFGSFRAVAVVALAHHHGGGRVGTAAFVEAARDDAFHVRETALQLFEHVGAPASAAAMELLRSGDIGDEYQEPLARTAVQGDVGDVLAFLESRLSTDAALATTVALLARTDLEPHEWTAVHAALPRIVQPHLSSPQFPAWNNQLAAAAARAGNVILLRDLATSSLLTVEMRKYVIDVAFSNEATIDAAPDLHVAVLTDPASPQRLVRQLLSRLGAEDVRSARYSAMLWNLARHHEDRWVREDARIRLQYTNPADGRGLEIVSATYGKDGKTVDVRDLLAAMITDGRLGARASNDLAGDPNFGVQKELVVTYTLDGKRHTRTATEGNVVSIP